MLSVQELRDRWQGVVIPLITPFSADLSIDFHGLEKNVLWLIEQGANKQNTVLLAAGSGGDFTAMTIKERKQVIKIVSDIAAGQIPVISSAQSTDIRECIELCNFAEQVGLDAMQLSGPFYYDGRPGDVLAWMNQVAKHTEMGFAVYNNWYSGYDMPLNLIDEILDIPNSISIKWGSPNVFTFMEGIRRFIDRAVIVDNAFLPELSYPLGVRCHVSHLPNFYPQNSWRVHELFLKGDFAGAKAEWDRCMVPWLRLVAPIQAATGAEGVFVRPAMTLAGLIGGHSRLPSRDQVIDPEIRAAYEAFLSDYCQI